MVSKDRFVEKSACFRFVKPLFLAGIDKGFNHELCRCFTQRLKFVNVSKKGHVNLSLSLINLKLHILQSVKVNLWRKKDSN